MRTAASFLGRSRRLPGRNDETRPKAKARHLWARVFTCKRSLFYLLPACLGAYQLQASRLTTALDEKIRAHCRSFR